MVDRPSRERFELKLPGVEKGGRYFTRYEPNIALDIVERVADGELLSKICAKEAVPLTVTKQTFLRWVATVPELASAYAAAVQISAHSFEEMAIDKAERTAAAPGTPQNVSAASLLISQYRWSAARRNPTKYSDKGNTQIVVPVNISTSLNLGPSGNTIESEVPDIYTISLDVPSIAERSEAEGKILEGEFEEIAPKAAAETDLLKKEDFRALLRPDIPVVGHERQPALAAKNKGGSLPGPRKRVLTPRKPK